MPKMIPICMQMALSNSKTFHILPANVQFAVLTPSRSLTDDRVDRTEQIAKHNLYVLKAEVGTVKQAIVDGRLWEYVMLKARAHPKLMKAMDLFKNFEFLEDGTPLFKSKAIFLYEPIDQYRPEVRRFRRIVSTFRSVVKKNLVLYPIVQLQPFYTTRDFVQVVKKFPMHRSVSTINSLGLFL